MKLGVRSQLTGGRLRDICRRYSVGKRSREIASHHLAGETVSAASFGPDIQPHALGAVMVIPSLSTSWRGPVASACLTFRCSNADSFSLSPKKWPLTRANVAIVRKSRERSFLRRPSSRSTRRGRCGRDRELSVRSSQREHFAPACIPLAD